ncbi:MAG: sensor histidine kinase, partial [Caldithrix sp.]|nr:sensor histidine kinase [Caldithrix sp.]
PLRVDLLQESLKRQRSVIKQLVQNKRQGYTKIESMTMNKTLPNQFTLLFVADTPPIGKYIVGMVINQQSFIQTVLGPKIEEFAGQQFDLGIFDDRSGREIFASGSFSINKVQIKRKLWVFPNLYLGINLRGQTISELVQKRFYQSLVFMVFLNIILIAGAIFLYRSITKEVQLAQLKTDFVANVSHELRTPLALIRMYAETLSLDRISSKEKQMHYYDIIEKESERLTLLVNNILDFSRMESGKKKYQNNPVDLNQITADVLDIYDYKFKTEHFSVKTSLAQEKLILHGDRDAITEAIINILDNALKYSSSSKQINIATGRENGFVFVEVQDFGTGISATHQKKIFEKFFRVDSGDVHKTRGSGLGLTLVQYIVEAHNGDIHLNSSPGEGSTFKLRFPTGV